jgi:hypothetical protein
MPLLLQQILIPQILGWLGMWVGSLVVSNAISTKTHMRNVLASAGRVWTRQEEAARLLLAAELEDTQEQVAAMSDDALANLALKLMMVGGHRGSLGAQQVQALGCRTNTKGIQRQHACA